MKRFRFEVLLDNSDVLLQSNTQSQTKRYRNNHINRQLLELLALLCSIIMQQ